MSEATSIDADRSPPRQARHACAFFASSAEAYRVLLPFIAEGFANGEKAIHVIRPDKEFDHLQHLIEVGIDVASARHSGQLEIRHNGDVYLVDGRFDPDRMLTTFEAIARSDRAAGFSTKRIVCDMEWAADQHHADLLRFEAKVNDVWSRHADIVICVYAIANLTGDMVIDIMRTHPMVLVGNVLHENPYFIPPEQFLRDRLDES